MPRSKRRRESVEESSEAPSSTTSAAKRASAKRAPQKDPLPVVADEPLTDARRGVANAVGKNAELLEVGRQIEERRAREREKRRREREHAAGEAINILGGFDQGAGTPTCAPTPPAAATWTATPTDSFNLASPTFVASTTTAESTASAAAAKSAAATGAASHRVASTVAPVPAMSRSRRERLTERQYVYGNYPRYYGYRTPHHTMDPRIVQLKARMEWTGKHCFDVGCNAGEFAIATTKHLGLGSMHGIDLDESLIAQADRTLAFQFSLGGLERTPSTTTTSSSAAAAAPRPFPISFPLCQGALPITRPHATEIRRQAKSIKAFPHNITFATCNVMTLPEGSLPFNSTFDIVFCMSVTKWIHLNYGDDGLKRLFRILYAHLRPGGVLVLEPQGWASYKKKKNLNETFARNFNEIRLYPQAFPALLCSPEVGFISAESITPQNEKAFDRPMYLCQKKR